MSYSPTLGRWVQADPKGYVDGMNLYEGLRSNPIRHRDPLGLQVVEEPNDEAKELQAFLDEYRDALQAVFRAAGMVSASCRDSAEAVELMESAKNLLLNTNTLITAGLSGVTAQKFLNAKNLLVPWVRNKVGAVGTKLTMVGIGFEAINFGSAAWDGEYGEALSSGAIITGSIWGLWNPYVAVATGLGAIGKAGIQAYYEDQMEDVDEASRVQCCEAYLKIMRDRIKRVREMEAGVSAAIARLLEIGNEDN